MGREDFGLDFCGAPGTLAGQCLASQVMKPPYTLGRRCFSENSRVGDGPCRRERARLRYDNHVYVEEIVAFVVRHLMADPLVD